MTFRVLSLAAALSLAGLLAGCVATPYGGGYYEGRYGYPYGAYDPYYGTYGHRIHVVPTVPWDFRHRHSKHRHFKHRDFDRHDHHDHRDRADDWQQPDIPSGHPPPEVRRPEATPERSRVAEVERPAGDSRRDREEARWSELQAPAAELGRPVRGEGKR